MVSSTPRSAAAAAAAADGEGDPATAAGPEPGPSLLRLGPQDLEDCLALDVAGLGGLWTPQQWSRELEEEARPGIGLRQGGALVAMACGWLVVDELHITLVAVDPCRRRLGLGRRVLEALMRAGRELGAERATLEVAADNAAALALYAGCGFRSAGVRRHYYRDGSDALIQWATLEAAAPGPGPSDQVGPGGHAPIEGRFPEDC